MTTINQLDPKIWDKGLNELKAIKRRSSVEVKQIKPNEENITGKELEQNLLGYLTHIVVAGALYAAPFRRAGYLFKKPVDGRGTEGQKGAIKAMIKDLDAVQIATLTGEGPKDAQSVYIPTGTVFSNVADDTIVKTKIHWNTDPVDGTNNTIGKNKDNSFVGGATSIALFAKPINPHKPAFVAFPDEVSIWSYSTPSWVPKVGLVMQGNSIAEVVEKNVKLIAEGCLKQKLGRLPKPEELASYIKNEFKAALMNRPFQNLEVLKGLKNAGVNIDFQVKPDGKSIDFSSWQSDGDTLSTKHFKKGNVLIIGDGNIMVPYMKDVHLNIGNGGGPETLQILPGTREMVTLFLSKDRREKMPINTLFGEMFRAINSADKNVKEEVLKKIFSEKEIKALQKHGFNAEKVFTVYNKDILFSNTKDYITSFSAITDLEKTRALFDVPGMAGVKINPKDDTVETSAMAVTGSGGQFLLKEKFVLKSASIKVNLMDNLTKLEEMNKSILIDKEKKEMKELLKVIMADYISLAKEYIFFGCFDIAKAVLDDFIKTIENYKQQIVLTELKEFYYALKVKSQNLKHYIDQIETLQKVTPSELKKKENLERLKELKKLNDELLNSDLTPGIDGWLKRDLLFANDELTAYIKALEKAK